MRRALVLLLAILAGCQAQDTDTLQRIGRKTATRLHEASGGQRGPLTTTWQALRSDRLANRVALRLRWDKACGDLEVVVDQPRPGVVRLRGQAPDTTCKARAIEVARNTTGVERVEDELTLAGKGE